MITLTTADLAELAHQDQGTADHLASGRMSIRTHCREILAAWNGIASVYARAPSRNVQLSTCGIVEVARTAAGVDA